MTYALRQLVDFGRGRFSIIVKAIDSTTNRVVVAKLMETNAKTEPEIDREFEIYRMMRHERIAYLIEAFKYKKYLHFDINLMLTTKKIKLQLEKKRHRWSAPTMSKNHRLHVKMLISQ